MTLRENEVNYKRFDSSEGNVWKYVFDFETAIAEAVLYKYESFDTRTVICCSVQSGCPVGCVFCGTGNKFIRNLTADEIILQVKTVLKDKLIEGVNHSCAKFQIMFMSMGEPFLNIDEVLNAIEVLHREYPNAELLVSTVGLKSGTNSEWEKFANASAFCPKIGLQFSLHSGYDKTRNTLIPFKNKLSIREMRDVGIAWWNRTGRKVFLNYCVNESNLSDDEVSKIKDIFSPCVFNLTFSVICSKDSNMKEAGFNKVDIIRDKTQSFIKDNYNVRIFDPAGQDDIGGGCGQLWYTQEWIKIHNLTKYEL